VVQFEVDACLSQEQGASSEEDELVNAVTAMGLSDQAQGATSATASSSTLTGSGATQGKSKVFGLTIHHQGHADLPHSSIVEMASSKRRRVKWNEKYPQLYFSQTGNYYLGKHERGKFKRIDKWELSSPELQKKNARLQPVFKQLEEALGQIQSIVREHGKEERLSLAYEGRRLTVHRNPTTSSCLPPEALKLFD
jgi:hypothetical protein